MRRLQCKEALVCCHDVEGVVAKEELVCCPGGGGGVVMVKEIEHRRNGCVDAAHGEPRRLLIGCRRGMHRHRCLSWRHQIASRACHLGQIYGGIEHGDGQSVEWRVGQEVVMVRS